MTKADILLQDVDLEHPDIQLLVTEFKFWKIGKRKLKFKVMKR